jgi:hypothetical protein
VGPGRRVVRRVEAGAGEPTVVLEAGLNNGAASWQRVMPLLAPHVRVAAYDRAGLGGSAPAPGLVTIDRQIDDLASVITGLAAGPCVLAGVGQAAERDKPRNFSQLVGDEYESVLEGRYLLRWHRVRERKPALREKKIRSVQARGDALACEACGLPALVRSRNWPDSVCGRLRAWLKACSVPSLSRIGAGSCERAAGSWSAQRPRSGAAGVLDAAVRERIMGQPGQGGLRGW